MGAQAGLLRLLRRPRRRHARRRAAARRRRRAPAGTTALAGHHQPAVAAAARRRLRRPTARPSGRRAARRARLVGRSPTRWTRPCMSEPEKTTMSNWPELPYESWEPTKQTLHRYTQIVGKVRMALVPSRNHWWHVTLYVTERGLTTGPMPSDDRDVAVDFDLLEHQLIVSSSDGRRASFPPAHRPAVADFYSDFFAALAKVDVDV